MPEFWASNAQFSPLMLMSYVHFFTVSFIYQLIKNNFTFEFWNQRLGYALPQFRSPVKQWIWDDYQECIQTSENHNISARNFKLCYNWQIKMSILNVMNKILIRWIYNTRGKFTRETIWRNPRKYWKICVKSFLKSTDGNLQFTKELPRIYLYNRAVKIRKFGRKGWIT